MDLKRLAGWVFDLDGVIWAGHRPMPGAPALVAALRAAGRGVVFLTNNSGQPAPELAQKLTGLGIPANPDQVVSAMSAAGDYLRDRYGNVRVLASGSAAMLEVLRGAGHTLVTDPAEAEAVVMGRDPKWTYSDLVSTCRAVERGIPFLALNMDLRYPVADGWFPGCGALAASVTAATGRHPEVVGKPARLLFQAALERLGIPAREAVMVGDTPASDIAGGLSVGMWTVLIGDATPEPAPHLQVSDPAALLQLWQAG